MWLGSGTYAVLRDVPLYKPIIAAINGPCVAGGMEMLGGIDIRIASPNASFGVMEPRRGSLPGRHDRPPPPPAQLAGGHGVPPDGRGPARPARPRARPHQRGGPRESLIDEARVGPAHHGQRSRSRYRERRPLYAGLLVDLEEAYKIERELPGRVLYRGRQGRSEGVRREANAGLASAVRVAVDPRSPCIIGVAQQTWRPKEAESPEPLTMWEEISRSRGRHWRTTSLRTSTACRSCTARPGSTTTRPARSPERSAGRRHHPGSAARRRRCACAGRRRGDASRRVRLRSGGRRRGPRHAPLAKAGIKPPWSHAHPQAPPMPFEAAFHPAELAHEVFSATLPFSLFDIGRRAALGIPLTRRDPAASSRP